MTPLRHNHGRRLPTRAGLTLVEVLLAVALLGTGVSILLVSVQRGLAVARRAVQLETARRLFTAIELNDPVDWSQVPPDPRTEGDFDPPFSDYRWEREIEPYGDPDLPLYVVTTRIRWGGTREGGETFVGLRFVDGEAGGAVEGAAPEARGGRP